jgi:hypothetical protein
MVPIPHCYMRHFVAGPLTPRQAWGTVGHGILSYNDQAACAPLLDSLCLACIRNAAGDTASPPARPESTVPLADALLVQHQTELIAHKLLGLNHTPILASGQQVAQSLGELVTEQWATHQQQDVLDLHKNNSTLKTIEECYGAIPVTVGRWCT